VRFLLDQNQSPLLAELLNIAGAIVVFDQNRVRIRRLPI